MVRRPGKLLLISIVSYFFFLQTIILIIVNIIFMCLCFLDLFLWLLICVYKLLLIFGRILNWFGLNSHTHKKAFHSWLMWMYCHMLTYHQPITGQLYGKSLCTLGPTRNMFSTLIKFFLHCQMRVLQRATSSIFIVAGRMLISPHFRRPNSGPPVKII